MMIIENTTGRLLHPVYKVPRKNVDPNGPREEVLPIYHTNSTARRPLVGVPPGTHTIDEVSAKILLAHQPNKIFFESAPGHEPFLKIRPGTAKSQEEEEKHQPVSLRCRSEAIAAFQKTAKVAVKE